MRITTLILLAVIMQVSAASYAQKISLSEKKTPMTKVFIKISQQSGYDFMVSGSTLADTKPVTIEVKNMDINEVLQILFKDQPITFTLDNKVVNVSRKEIPLSNKKATEGEALGQFTSISGTILNEDKMPIEGASVFIKGSSVGTLTNANGYFRLEHAADNAVLRISCIGYLSIDVGVRKFKDGYMAYSLQKERAENVISNKGEEVTFTVRLLTAVGDLNGISVNAESGQPKQIGTVVDLRHRSHLNLGQVLEGSIPGLTLKSTTSTTQELSLNSAFFLPDEDRIYTGVEELKELYRKMLAANPTYRNGYPTFESFYNHALSFSTNLPIPGYSTVTTTTSSSGLVPELRGGSSFLGNTSGMLVVIDGIEQTGFPANYPMINVAGIEIIRDPVELVKWGPRATGGVILITTNKPVKGKLQFTYSSNLYYTARPDISNNKLQLASTPDVLAYYKEQVDKGLASYIPAAGSTAEPPNGLKPAPLLLFNLKKNNLPYTDAQFIASWDSLASISNRDQLRVLYPSQFRQSHALTMSGGTDFWVYTLGGNYEHSKNNFSGNNGLRLNLSNNLNLLKNRLRINWVLNANEERNEAAPVDGGSSLDPYQLLLKQGYVYDYPNSSFALNQAMQKLGYENSGVNLLEDALNKKSSAKNSSISSNLMTNLDLSESLQWSTAFKYDRRRNRNNNLLGSASSDVRQLRNNFGSPDDSSGVTMYIPEGDILYSNNSNALTWNLRSGLNFTHTFGTRHLVNAAVGLAAAHNQRISPPGINIYGYNQGTQAGQPLLPFPDQGIINYFGATQYAQTLLAPNVISATYDRNFSVNGNLNYGYDNRYLLNIRYGSVYTPNVGFIPSYSGTKNQQARASWLVNNEHFFNVPAISTLTLSALASKIQLGRSPDIITSNLISQPLWSNNALIATGYTPSQLNGQSLKNIGGGLEIGLWKERVYLKANYNHSSDRTHQINGQIGYAISREPWFKVPFISKLIVDATIQNFNSLQAQVISMETNLPDGNGEFSLASSSNFGILPPATINKEAHLALGLFNNRLTFDTRYYHKIISSTTGAGLLQPDPSTGLTSQLSYSKLLNKGFEVILKGAVIERPKFTYSVSIIGAYITNQALDIPDIPFTQFVSYLTALRTGYATDGLWSYRWAGLDDKGDPQIYKDNDIKVPVLSGTDANGNAISTQLDASSLVYSGRTQAPWFGGLIQEWYYRNFFAIARMDFKFGHIMRTYMPVAGPGLEKNMLIGKRWQQPGDETRTDVAAMAPYSATRALVIQNSSNSIAPADNIRFSELQLGCQLDPGALKNKFIKTLTVSVQARNLALWKRNKLGLDPATVSSNGTVSIQEPRQYSLSITSSF